MPSTHLKEPLPTQLRDLVRVKDARDSRSRGPRGHGNRRSLGPTNSGGLPNSSRSMPGAIFKPICAFVYAERKAYSQQISEWRPSCEEKFCLFPRLALAVLSLVRL